VRAARRHDDVPVRSRRRRRTLGLLAREFPGLGDLTFEVGIVLAFGLYAVLRPRSSR